MNKHREDIITSKRNRRIIEARKLGQRQERFLVEGLQLLHMAVASGVLMYTWLQASSSGVEVQGGI